MAFRTGGRDGGVARREGAEKHPDTEPVELDGTGQTSQAGTDDHLHVHVHVLGRHGLSFPEAHPG